MAASDKNISIHWVVALRPEAEILIRSLKLKPFRRSNGGFPIWKSEAARTADSTPVIHWLVLSGIGKTNAAAASAWLQSANGGEKGAGWINFGIAGHRDLALGSVIRANRITDAATGKSWYPAAVWKRKNDLKSAGLRTIDLPSTEYPDSNEMIDMEAAGMISIAIRFASLELIQSIKVISDNSESDINLITKQSVQTQCAAAWSEIQPWLEAFEDIVQSEVERSDEPPHFVELKERFRFSETQTHQLKRLLGRHHATGTLDRALFENCRSSKDVIAALSENH